MRHRKVGKKFGRPAASRNAMLRNLAASIVLHEKVKTTEAKAKTVRSIVERAITTGKKPTLASRRKLLSLFYTQHPVNKIFEVLGPRYADRNGGYTRIVKLGSRKNDGAEVVRIELV
jgi:large subunit ribosomal protein L17